MEAGGGGGGGAVPLNDTVCVCVYEGGPISCGARRRGVCRDHSESRSVFLHGCVFYVETVVRACV